MTYRNDNIICFSFSDGVKWYRSVVIDAVSFPLTLSLWFDKLTTSDLLITLTLSLSKGRLTTNVAPCINAESSEFRDLQSGVPRAKLNFIRNIRRCEMPKFIDLSVTFGVGVRKGDSEITYITHEETVQSRIVGMYGLKASDMDIRGGRYCAMEKVSLTTHEISHLDAPWHYTPVSEGKPAKKIDEIPLEWCYGDGVVLDFHHKKAGERISAAEVESALKKINYKLKPWDIVLIRTDAYKHWGKPDYRDIHPGMTRESTLWLIERGIKVMGIDAYGWDRPHKMMAEEVKKTGKKELFWEAHFAGIEKEYLHLEDLANLDKLPKPFGFKVIAFPIKIAGASAGWVRAVAMLED